MGLKRRKKDSPSPRLRLAEVAGARKEPVPPQRIKPELAVLADTPPEGDDWIHEIKYDGYRILSRIKNKKIVLFTRHGKDWTRKFPSIARALAKLSIDDAWLDGEVVFIKEDGTTSFEGLQKALSEGRVGGLKYVIFDIISMDGYGFERTPLIERKRIIKRLFAEKKADRKILRYGDYTSGNGKEFFSKACRLSLEGIVSKQMGSPYIYGRSHSWIKVKCRKRQEFVIGGYAEAGGSRKGIGALIVGVYDDKGRLIYAGRVGTGFTEKIMTELYGKLGKIEKKATPFYKIPSTALPSGVRWVRPVLVAEVEFSEWTGKGVLRQASFEGLRDDKSAREITRESPQAIEKIMREKRPSRQARIDKGALSRDIKTAVKLINPDRLFYPKQGITKKALADYYEAVSRFMLPHLSGRPLTLLRCPESFRDCFFQKHAADAMPEEIKRIELREEGRRAAFMMVDSLEGLISLVQIGALEIHTWGSRSDNLEHPDRAAFDIDPGPGVAWERLAEAATLVHEILAELGIKSFVKTTGGKGLHVVFPLDATNSWGEVEAFTRAFAEFVSRKTPDRFTPVMTKKRREGKIYLDYLRNLRGSTIVELFSTRARENAPISFPIEWNKLVRVRSDFFTVRNFKKYMKKEPWKGYFAIRQRITKNMMKRIKL